MADLQVDPAAGLAGVTEPVNFTGSPMTTELVEAVAVTSKAPPALAATTGRPISAVSRDAESSESVRRTWFLRMRRRSYAQVTSTI